MGRLRGSVLARRRTSPAGDPLLDPEVQVSFVYEPSVPARRLGRVTPRAVSATIFGYY